MRENNRNWARFIGALFEAFQNSNQIYRRKKLFPFFISLNSTSFYLNRTNISGNRKMFSAFPKNFEKIDRVGSFFLENRQTGLENRQSP